MRIVVKLVVLVGLAGTIAAADEPPRPVAPPPRERLPHRPERLPDRRLAPKPRPRRGVQGHRDQHLRRPLEGADRGAARPTSRRTACASSARRTKSRLKHNDDPTIVAWMHGDEPDNAQSLGKGKGYGPPILPAKIVEDYERIKKADPSRPGAPEPRPGRRLGQLHRPRRAAPITPRTTPSTSRAATSPRSTSTPPSTTTTTSPASCGSSPTA